MVQDRVQLRDVPILFRGQQRRNQDEGKIRVAIRQLGRAVHLDPRDIAAPLARTVEEQHQRISRPVRLARFRHTGRDEELIFVAPGSQSRLRVLPGLGRRRGFERAKARASRQNEQSGQRTC